MLQSYVTAALRTLRRHKGYTALNVGGLAVSLAACLVIGLFIAQSLSYDRFHPAAERTFRLVALDPDAPGEGNATLPPGLAHALERRFPEVEVVTEVQGWQASEALLTYGGEHHHAQGVLYADSNFFDAFGFRLLQGDPAAALAAPNQIVLSASTARRIFGDADPLGQTVLFSGRADYRVSGVVEDPPPNTHLPVHVLFSLSGRAFDERYGDEVQWPFYRGRLYTRLKPGTDAAALAAKLNAFQAEQRPPEMGNLPLLALQPLPDIHLYSDLNGEYAPTSDVRYLYLFGGIGLLLLVIACVNYMNLATARSVKRAREVGIRKVVGAARGQLVAQFLGESVLVALVALPLAFLLAVLALPWVNAATGQALAFSTAAPAVGVLGVAGLLLLVGVGAGSYPALYLSAFRPVRVLKGAVTGGRGHGWLRQGLVVLQFAASFVLIVGALVAVYQLRFLQETRLGFDEAHVVTLNAPFDDDRYATFKAALADEPGVLAVTSGPPLGIGHKNAWMSIQDPKGGPEKISLDQLVVDYGYLRTMGLRLTDGRDFSPDRATDAEGAVILSESAVQALGVEAAAIGQPVEQPPLNGRRVIGVVEDFHNASLHEPVVPVQITLQPGWQWTALVRLAPGRTAEGLAALERVWQALVPDRPFQFEFLDAQIQAQYLAEQRLARIFGVFAGLAVFVACLGLFGLAAFTAEQRTKEIGIRKVLGATVPGVVGLLSKDFLRLVVVAVALASPLAYLAARRWLSDFAYHVDLGPGTFALAGALALLVAVLSVGYQSLRAALMNPANALRQE